MKNSKPLIIKSIAEVHRLIGLPKPQHPLISLIDLKGVDSDPKIEAVIFDFYIVSLKRGCDNLIYGHQKYDFDEGLMAFLSPGQVLRSTVNEVSSQIEGWMLLIHPDFLWGYQLAKKIKQYQYFGYAINEALFLSNKEEHLINEIIDNIKNEYNSNIDKFSQEVIIAQLELLFTYAHRFYERQFITRKITNSEVLIRLEDLLLQYYDSNDLKTEGLPTVQYLANKLSMSPKYLSSLLKQHTGLSTQQHIHEKLIDKAKEKLAANQLTISEIAFELGFEHPQSFSKFFKSKTNKSPIEFRLNRN